MQREVQHKQGAASPKLLLIPTKISELKPTSQIIKIHEKNTMMTIRNEKNHQKTTKASSSSRIQIRQGKLVKPNRIKTRGKREIGYIHYSVPKVCKRWIQKRKKEFEAYQDRRDREKSECIGPLFDPRSREGGKHP